MKNNKLNKAKFNLQFDLEKEDQNEVSELLKTKGNSKSKYITNAIKFFVENNEGKEVKEKGLYLGTSRRTKKPIIKDFNDDSMSSFVLGSVGSGVIFNVKNKILDLYNNTDDDIIILDSYKNCNNLTEYLNGKIINFDRTDLNKGYINAFDIDNIRLDYEGKLMSSPISAKSEFIIYLMSIILGIDLSKNQISIIDRCVYKIYQEFESSNYTDFNKIPTLIDFYDEMDKFSEESEIKNLLAALEPYIVGGMRILNSKTNTEIKKYNRVTTYNIKTIEPGLDSVINLITLEKVFNQVITKSNYGNDLCKRTNIVINNCDEFLNNKYIADYIHSFIKISRMLNVSFIFSTSSNITELLKKDTVRLIIYNKCTHVTFLKLSKYDNEIISSTFDLRPSEISFLNYATAVEEGLIWVSNTYTETHEFYNDNVGTINIIKSNNL